MTASPVLVHPNAETLSAWRSDDAWERRLRLDSERAERHQSREQAEITALVVSRALEGGAEAIALTGSTARGERTDVSDLDYHVVGARPYVLDMPGDVDIYAGAEEHFWRKLRGGDDFVQWTLRFGCILEDRGVFRAGLREISRRGLWPDWQSKLARVPEHVRLARRLVDVGDRDAAQEQIRAALTAALRGQLLRERTFPLARRELSEQAHQLGYAALADALDETIYGEPSLEELKGFLRLLRALSS